MPLSYPFVAEIRGSNRSIFKVPKRNLPLRSPEQCLLIASSAQAQSFAQWLHDARIRWVGGEIMMRPCHVNHSQSSDPASPKMRRTGEDAVVARDQQGRYVNRSGPPTAKRLRAPMV